MNKQIQAAVFHHNLKCFCKPMLFYTIVLRVCILLYYRCPKNLVDFIEIFNKTNNYSKTSLNV